MRLHEILLSLRMPKAHGILRELKWESFFLNLYQTFANIFFNVLYPSQLQAMSLLTDNGVSKPKGTTDKGMSIMNTDSLPVISKNKSSMSKLNLMYSMPVAELFCENTARKFFFINERYNVNKYLIKKLKENKTYTDYLLWD